LSETKIESGEQQISVHDIKMLLSILPVSIREQIDIINRPAELLEVVLDLGRRPSARYVGGEIALRDGEVRQEEIDLVVSSVSDFDDDNRAGIARSLHRISAIRNRRGMIVGLTCRVGRAVFGTVDIISDIVNSGKSIVLVGRPGVGKTTMLREMARILAEGRRVIVVDTSNEIGGDGDIPHPAVGQARRMQVTKPVRQHEVMIEAVENHNPEVIIIDEIGREQEAAAARTINERGVQLIGTAHGNTLENLLLNPTLSDLVGGIESVTLSDEEARRRGTQKTVLERRSPPTFDVLIEIQDRKKLAVHKNVADSVDAMLRGRSPVVEQRFYDENGRLHVERQADRDTFQRGAGRKRPVGELKIVSQKGGKATENGQRPNAGGGRKKGLLKELKVSAYGVARNRLYQAARNVGVKLTIVEEIADAEVFVTLKSYYRRHRKLIIDAQNRGVSVFVMRANTVTQMERFILQAAGGQEQPEDHVEAAVDEAQRGITAVKSGQDSVDLAPASSAVRRYQHQLAREADLVSHSYGDGSNRHVRIFSASTNESLEERN